MYFAGDLLERAGPRADALCQGMELRVSGFTFRDAPLWILQGPFFFLLVGHGGRSFGVRRGVCHHFLLFPSRLGWKGCGLRRSTWRLPRSKTR